MDSPLSLFLVVASPTSLPNLFLGPNSTPTHTHPTSPLDDRAVSPTPERVRVVLTHEGDLADGPVIVQPFRHQVGGHTAVVTVPGSPFVAKPMDPKKREHAFYLRAPKALGGFVPAFYGVRSAEFGAVVTGEPDRREHASIDDESGPVVTTDDTLAAGRRGLTFSEGPLGEGPDCARRPQPVMKSAPLASLPNPWSLTMYQKALDKTADSSGTTDFILLENLTAKFKRPCVMDIKIGKRTYADDASPKKRARAEAKCRATTSHVLGFRLCGMQVYSEPNGRYLRKDKYYGRELTPATVPDALSRFFSLNLDKPLNSSPRAQEIVKALSDRLATLREALRTLSGMRFYSSSVLVVYEGDVSVRRSPESLVDLRIIDFANTTLSEVDGPDDAFIFGLTTLESMLRGLVESQVCGQ
eukprot:m.386774 g.386774  ORF g.386774 m.386774 type:complete len:413 (+) comp28281_c0_seq40:462-1700(+)